MKSLSQNEIATDGEWQSAHAEVKRGGGGRMGGGKERKRWKQTTTTTAAAAAGAGAKQDRQADRQSGAGEKKTSFKRPLGWHDQLDWFHYDVTLFNPWLYTRLSLSLSLFRVSSSIFFFSTATGRVSVHLLLAAQTHSTRSWQRFAANLVCWFVRPWYSR